MFKMSPAPRIIWPKMSKVAARWQLSNDILDTQKCSNRGPPEMYCVFTTSSGLPVKPTKHDFPWVCQQGPAEARTDSTEKLRPPAASHNLKYEARNWAQACHVYHTRRPEGEITGQMKTGRFNFREMRYPKSVPCY